MAEKQVFTTTVTEPEYALFSSTATYMKFHARAHREPWPFGSVLERPPDSRWDPTKVMHVASWDEEHIEVVHLIGPRAGEHERVNPLDWRLVPETEF